MDHVRSRDAEKGDAEITDKARHVVNELWPPEADNRGKQLAKGDQILAIPTLVRKLPEPLRKIIGDLSNTERVLVGLDLREPEAS